MATLVKKLGELVGKGAKSYNNLTRDTAGVLTGPLNKGWRAKILINRLTSGLPKDQSLKGKAFNPNTSALSYAVGDRRSSRNPIANRELQQQWRMRLQFGIDGSKLPTWDESTDPASGRSYLDKKNMAELTKGRPQYRIVIYNLSSNPMTYIELQNRPMELEFRGETTWATIKSMGRNTPMYHYIGSEDVINFNVSWFCNDPKNPEEVLTKCRLLESWTKSNGYQAGPPILKIEWGTSKMFEDHYYILSSATYTLKNFQNGSYDREHDVYHEKKLLPAVATQELNFKRVSAYNLSYGDFLDLDAVKHTQGIYNG